MIRRPGSASAASTRTCAAWPPATCPVCRIRCRATMLRGIILTSAFRWIDIVTDRRDRTLICELIDTATRIRVNAYSPVTTIARLCHCDHHETDRSFREEIQGAPFHRSSSSVLRSYVVHLCVCITLRQRVDAFTCTGIWMCSWCALPHPKRYPTRVVASNKMLPIMRRQPRGLRHQQDGKARVNGNSARPLTSRHQPVAGHSGPPHRSPPQLLAALAHLPTAPGAS